MNIEYFGLPATGKTYLCQELKNYLIESGAKDIAVQKMIDSQNKFSFNAAKLINAANFILFKPKIAFRMLKVIEQGNLKNSRHRITKSIYFLSELRKAETGAEEKKTVTEQGVLQAIWSLEMLSRRSIIEPLLKLTAGWLPDGIIHIESPDNQFYVEQISNRDNGQSQFDNLSRGSIYESLDTATRVSALILERSKHYKADIQTISLVNDHTLDVTTTAKWIAAL